jgi:mannose-6-phosphate isomerase-like protein (cupin superfamily)
MNALVLNRADLPFDGSTYEFVGAEYADTQVSFIWVYMPPGVRVLLHRHPYAEIFIIQACTGTYTVGEERLTAQAGQIIIVPAGAPHKFSNTGSEPLRQIDIHQSPRFITEWLED